MIDGGPLTPQGDAGTRVVVPFLRRMGVERVAVVVATHGDADHLGGIPAVVTAFAPDLVLEPGEPLGRPHYLRFLATVEASRARYRAARAGDRIVLDGVTLEVLSPDSALFALPLDVNEHGVVLRVTYGDVRLLFQADAGLPVEQHLAGQVGRVELLKVGHHGSRTATSDAWLVGARAAPGGDQRGAAQQLRTPRARSRGAVGAAQDRDIGEPIATELSPLPRTDNVNRQTSEVRHQVSGVRTEVRDAA